MWLKLILFLQCGDILVINGPGNTVCWFMLELLDFRILEAKQGPVNLVADANPGNIYHKIHFADTLFQLFYFSDPLIWKPSWGFGNLIISP